MSNSNIDLKIKDLITKEDSEVPTIVLNRIEDTLKALPVKKKPNRKLKRALLGFISTAAAAGILIGVGFSSTTMAQILKKVPIIESVFEMTKYEGLDKAHNKGMSTKVAQSATDHGMTLSITEILYDGSRVLIGYTLSSEDEISTSNPYMDIKIDGKRIGNYGVGGGGQLIDPFNYVGVIHIDSAEKLPEQFKLDLNFNQINETEGNWDFYLSVKENKQDRKTLLPMANKKSEETSITLEKVIFSVTSTELDFYVSQPIDQGNITRFELLDDQGNVIRSLSGSSKPLETTKQIRRVHYKEVFEPLEQLPKSITIRPVEIDHEKMNPNLTKQLEMTVDVK